KEVATVTRILVTGATSLIGHYLLPRLAQGDDRVITAVSRQTQPSTGNVRWISSDISAAKDSALLDEQDALLHLAPLWTLPAWLERSTAPGIRRVIAFSSTSRFTKTASRSSYERGVAEALASAEGTVAEWAVCHGVDWTIFRPTLVYGGGRDKNIAAIARFIQRFYFFPVVGAATGLRMPVHADDLAAACLLALKNPRTFGHAYDLTGGETLSYRAMVERVFNGLEMKPRVLAVPSGILRAAIQVATLLPGARDWTPEMAERMALDLVFDCAPARKDFDYAPRPFRPTRRDLAKG
ncbi:MAG: NAD-dependent epimerase/dehydratase family protein, partial [Thiotrichales bacterium]